MMILIECLSKQLSTVSRLFYTVVIFLFENIVTVGYLSQQKRMRQDVFRYGITAAVLVANGMYSFLSIL